jgi:hypothetical protein
VATVEFEADDALAAGRQRRRGMHVKRDPPRGIVFIVFIVFIVVGCRSG